VFVGGGRAGLDALEREIGLRFAALEARFPLCAYDPPRQRLIPMARPAPFERLVRAYNATRGRAGKRPIPEVQIVRLWTPAERWRDPRPAVQRQIGSRAADERAPIEALRLGRDRADTRCALDVSMLEMCLRDAPELRPPRVVVRGRDVIGGAGVVEVARRLGWAEVEIERR
jgi:hypothetical protein